MGSRRAAVLARGVCAAAGVLLVATTAAGGEADVVAVAVTPTDTGYRFAVTVRHADEGWNHYAIRWQLLAPDGSVLATRVLRHPHVDEQPFTRSLANVEIPEGIGRVTVRARDSVHGFGGEEMGVDLPGRGD